MVQAEADLLPLLFFLSLYRIEKAVSFNLALFVNLVFINI
jgi:hypothetical protein